MNRGLQTLAVAPAYSLNELEPFPLTMACPSPLKSTPPADLCSVFPQRPTGQRSSRDE